MKHRSILNFIFYSSALLLFSCAQKSEDTNSVKPIVATNTTKDTTAQKSKITPKKDSILPKPILNFFDFDAVDHFKIDYDGKDYEDNSLNTFQMALLKKVKNDSVKFKFLDSILNNIIEDNIPINKNDLGLVKYLTDMGFIKNTISKNKYKELNQIFSFKTYSEKVSNFCIPIFRDLYVFKSKNRIIGFVKICFDCGDNQITGAKFDTKNFGTLSEYEQLKKL